MHVAVDRDVARGKVEQPEVAEDAGGIEGLLIRIEPRPVPEPRDQAFGGAATHFAMEAMPLLKKLFTAEQLTQREQFIRTLSRVLREQGDGEA